MNTIDILQKKRDGFELSEDEIKFLVNGYTCGEIPDYQMSAFLMASFINGLNTDETSFLTDAMLYSGVVLDLNSVEGIKVDKHSTGGVGDKPSLIIAPICAAAGVKVPMIAGRGLGHTGGTLDKLEAIPGFNVNLSVEKFKDSLVEIGFSLIGQTKEIAPADKKIYSLRDVTATVPSIPLISASIMSKKLAEGIDALVLDVKTGTGAFMQKFDDAVSLAESLTRLGKRMGKKVTSLITDMNQPLGNYVGNSLEIIESAEILKGKVEKGSEDLYEISIELSAHMIAYSNQKLSLEKAREIAKEKISDGSAYIKFRELVSRQGGDASVLEDYTKLPSCPNLYELKAKESGYLTKVDALAFGRATVALRGGRETMESKLDYGAGFILKSKVGDYVEEGNILCNIYYSNEGDLESALNILKSAYNYSEKRPDKTSTILKVIT